MDGGAILQLLSPVTSGSPMTLQSYPCEDGLFILTHQQSLQALPSKSSHSLTLSPACLGHQGQCSDSLPTLPAPALPMACSVQWSFKKKVSSHDSTAQNPPVTPSDLDATTACDSHEVCPGSSPARSPDLLAFPETCRTRSCHGLRMLCFLGCHSFQTPRIHSSLSPGLCSLSPSLTWRGK